MREFYQGIGTRLRRSRSVYEQLLGELVFEWQRERVPLEDYQRLTKYRPEKFWDGHATEATVLELRRYLEVLHLDDKAGAEPELPQVVM